MACEKHNHLRREDRAAEASFIPLVHILPISEKENEQE